MRSRNTLFGNRNFVLLWVGQAVSQLGDIIFNLAIMLKIFEMSGSTMAMGQIMACAILPQILMGFLIGPWIDRFNKVKVLILVDGARALLVLLAASTNSAGGLALLLFALSGLSAIFTPALTAFLPSLVSEEELFQANAATSTTQSFIALVGPAIGGFIIFYFNRNLSFYINSFSYLFSVLCIFLLKVKREQQQKIAGSGMLEEWLAGWRYVGSHKLVRSLIVAFVFFIFTGTSIEILLVSLVKNTLWLSTTWLGIVDSAWALGMLAGGPLAFTVRKKIRPLPTLFLGLFGAGMMMILLGLVPNGFIAIVVVAVMGVLNTIAAVASITVLQTTVPPELRGRVFSFRSTLIQAAAAMSMVIGGVLGDQVGVREAIMAAGAAELAWMVVWLGIRFYRSKKMMRSNS